ncbi:MAG: DHHA1 domain-containing protein [Candidatus Bathyarchaeia archaeon]
MNNSKSMFSLERVLCVSHGDDVDGLVCASYLSLMRGASILLTNYDELGDVLRRVQHPTNQVYICDLNIREEHHQEAIRISRFSKLTIVDHHPMTEATVLALQSAGATLIHSINDCASVLLSKHFRRELTHDELRLAAYAAVSDQFEDGPLARELLARFDRQLVQHEALMLTHALTMENSPSFKMRLVEELKVKFFPHLIEGVAEAALSYLKLATLILRAIPEEAVRLNRIAYAEAHREISTGTMASLILDALDVEAAASYRVVGEVSNFSIRGRVGSMVHLGDVTRRIAKQCGGFGGGHMKASGASIPTEKLMDFLFALDAELKEPKNP